MRTYPNYMALIAISPHIRPSESDIIFEESVVTVEMIAFYKPTFTVNDLFIISLSFVANNPSKRKREGTDVT